MGRAQDRYDRSLVVDFVQHAPGADPNTPQAPEISRQRTAGMRVFVQPADRFDNAPPIRPGDTLKLFLCAAPDSYRVAHAALPAAGGAEKGGGPG